MKLPKHNAYYSIYLQFLLWFTMNLILLLPMLIHAAGALTNETDRLALLKFKESIIKDPHGVLDFWNDSIHFCNWVGVTCRWKHQRVIALELEGYELSGFISPYIGNLSSVRSIILSNNRLFGQIPSEVGHLLDLEEIQLQNNTITGELPTSLANCSELRILHMTTNQLIGTIPMEFGSLSKLELLYLGVNNLTGGLPPSLGNISSLRNFSAARNNLDGVIPHEIGHLKKLTIFAIVSNKLSGTIPSSLYNISSISMISAAENKLNGNLPDYIGTTMSNLQLLELGLNQISGSIPVSLSNISGLQVIDLVGNNLVGSVPTDLGNLHELYWLGFGENNLGHNTRKDWDFMNSLINCSKLKYLDLGGNNVGGTLPKAIGNLSNQLEEVYFYSNKIYGYIPEEITSLTNLNILTLWDNFLTGMIPTSFGKLKKIQALHLQQNKLSGNIPSSLGNLSALLELYLNNNMFEGSIPAGIGNFQRLQSLDISENNLTGAIPQQLFSHFLLSDMLNLSHNSLSGSLPREVGNLKSTNSLDFSENMLSGEIPLEMGDCLSLEYLYLQGNSFQGSLPASLAALKGLRVLDLSQNNLSGKIPNNLQNLSYSSYLNISFNNLQGEVPIGGIFKNASAISLTGNRLLCGGVPQLQLPLCPTSVLKREKHHILKLVIILICVVLFFFLSVTLFAICWVRKCKGKTSTCSTIEELPKVSYRRLQQATGGFSPNNLIGLGSFASVYKAILDAEERVVAVKVLNLQKKGASKTFLTECNALKRIRHRNLLKILTCCSSTDFSGNDFKALVFEFMTNGSLEKWLHPEGSENKSLNFLQRLNVAIDVASALHYLHHECEQPILHCDLKPSNVLFDSDMVAHVSDFGLARLLSATSQVSQNKSSTIGLKGSVGYAAPEYGIGGEASKEGDIYSFGILVLELITGRRPTDELFVDDYNLHNYVKVALAGNLMKVVDPILLQEEAEAQNGEQRSNQTQASANNQALLSVLEIGLACSEESPDQRINMENVTQQLHKVKRVFLSSNNHGERPRFYRTAT